MANNFYNILKVNQLYPLKFKPILKDKIWGGQKLKHVLNKKDASDKSGESWEISGISGNISVVTNGFLKGNNLQELIEVYMDDLVGDKIFNFFGNEFPLLIKFIDADDLLSLQVHPDDELAAVRHGCYGKTEMWYVIQAKKDAELISGFNQKLDPKMLLSLLANGNIKEALHTEKVRAGDAFFIPAGRVHAINSGILLAEIQQSSDITYRIYDWDRLDETGQNRELHTQLGMDAIDFNVIDNSKINYTSELNQSTNLAECKYFTTNILRVDSKVIKDFYLIDSFVIYICTEGKVTFISGQGAKTMLNMGETVMIPAVLKEIEIIPLKKSTLLEVYVK